MARVAFIVIVTALGVTQIIRLDHAIACDLVPASKVMDLVARAARKLEAIDNPKKKGWRYSIYRQTLYLFLEKASCW